MSASGKSKTPQGGGELSGLLRHAETLQRELDRALAELRSEEVEAQDAAHMVTLRINGEGTPTKVSIKVASLSGREQRLLEDALLVALRSGLERLFTLRREKASSVTRGLQLPGLFL